jgi:hypothetical protein
VHASVDVKRWTIVALAVVSVSGCANYTWQKSGATAETAERDTRECEREARLIAAGYTSVLWPNPAWPWWPGPLGWRSPLYPWAPDPAWRLDVQRQATERCMEAKGYRLLKQPRG